MPFFTESKVPIEGQFMAFRLKHTLVCDIPRIEFRFMCLGHHGNGNIFNHFTWRTKILINL